MRHKPHLRLLAAGMVVILMAVVGVYSRSTMAVARATIYTNAGAGTAQCYGTTVRATYQDTAIGLGLLNFESNDAVYVDITFPDGSIFTQQVAFTDPASVGFDPDLSLDGVINQPVNAPAEFGSIDGGQGFASVYVHNTFPYGCYKVAARSSTHNAITAFAVKPRLDPPPYGGNAQLRVEDRTTGALSVQHGGAVNIIGEGFPANSQVYIWITAPDGTVLSWPEQFTDPNLIAQLQTNDAGRFVASFEFASYNAVGEYKFTAQNAPTNLNGIGQSVYTVIAPLRLDARPIQERGWADLRVSTPADASAPQRNIFEVQGERFTPGERVDLWVNFPDGSVRGYPSQFADDIGAFYVKLATDEVLPLGEYKMTAKGDQSGNLVITSFFVEGTLGIDPGPALGKADPYDPAIIDSSSDANLVQQPVLCTDSIGVVPDVVASANPGPDVSGENYSLNDCP